MMNVEEVTDAPVEGSAFLRHYCLPYEELPEQVTADVSTIIDPYIGWYRSTSHTLPFHPLDAKDPIPLALNPSESPIYRMIRNYEDLLYCRRYPDDERMRVMYCTHSLNHSLRSRKLVIKNNEKEKRMGVNDALRDQGFHRARTLILAPTKEAARRIVHTFLSLMPKGSTVSHRRRFERDFGPQEGETDKEKRKGHKPKDYEDWFSCNTSDHFRIGIGVAKRTLKLYSAFVDSDIIVASPLGLQTIIDEEKEKEADLQYITASIELLIIDQAEMLLMQNWATVQRIVGLLNQRPKKAAFASAARIRLAYLAGYGKRYRQTLIFSAVAAPSILLLTGECENFQGLNYVPPLPRYPGLFPSYLPDEIRVPGSKCNVSKPDTMASIDKRQRLENGCSAPSESGVAIKLNLISFAVYGQSSSIDVSRFDKSGHLESDDEVEDTELLELQQKVKKSRLNNGELSLSVEHIPQTDFTYLSGRAVPLARMNTFKQRVLPRLRRGLDQRVLIYVPDFYDLEELRALLRLESLDFCCVHEYTEDTEAERYRTLFADGRIRILILSERYYFFRRRKVRGAQNFIFFGPPTFPWFVKELIDTHHVSTETGEDTPIQLTFLYYPPYEAHLVAAITGKVDV
ncbi:unnamed protein product [Calicophoron daubneyi]|uniref:U3 small nucleolar RNA-associated protein 25 homolog n=1 Tax=Calicophoron daubneyi TaxID=300641 RepID=A0AAV2T2W0_CALDB